MRVDPICSVCDATQKELKVQAVVLACGRICSDATQKELKDKQMGKMVRGLYAYGCNSERIERTLWTSGCCLTRTGCNSERIERKQRKVEREESEEVDATQKELKELAQTSYQTPLKPGCNSERIERLDTAFLCLRLCRDATQKELKVNGYNCSYIVERNRRRCNSERIESSKKAVHTDNCLWF